jgi:arylsulfatase A-like enzyme
VAVECSSAGDARMIRTARYKYIAFARGENSELFFDMEKDPGETKNLVAEGALAGEVARHRELLKQWLVDTKDNFGKEAPPLKNKKGKQGRGGKNKAGKKE